MENELFAPTKVGSVGLRNHVVMSPMTRCRAQVEGGRPFINNPDLVERMRNDWPLSDELHQGLFYTVGAKGYTDYPLYSQQPAHV